MLHAFLLSLVEYISEPNVFFSVPYHELLLQRNIELQKYINLIAFFLCRYMLHFCSSTFSSGFI